ncbi:PREDICTED: regenerating islet-derived protein 4-like, partial [Nanorana parkeri]|uniref:regenerating islet-derived protein 4-like n=1 Tax=Nanorana parkeri TaxID=125878 RepID=UPI0008544B06
FDCQAYGHGAHLASIMDSSEANIIASHIFAYQKNQPVWIGLHDPEQNGRWKWNDGSMYNFRSWLPGQPDNHQRDEYCGEEFLQWNDRGCKVVQPYVCKYRP